MKKYLLAITILILLLSSVFAASTATLSGRVTDKNNAFVAGAKVELTNIATNAKMTVMTNGDGFYLVPELAPTGSSVQTSPSNGFNSLYQVGGARSLQFSLKFLF